MQAAVLTKEIRQRNWSSTPTLEGGTTVSVADAAKLCKVSDDTIRRRLHDDAFEGAFRDGPGDAAPWRIPVASLIAIGLCETEVLDELDQRLNPNIARLTNQLVDIRAELQTERTKREAAEHAYTQAKEQVEYLRRTVDHLFVAFGNPKEGRTN